MSEHAEHTASSYVKTWVILLVLFLVSVFGPMLEIRWLTMITAFGIGSKGLSCGGSFYAH